MDVMFRSSEDRAVIAKSSSHPFELVVSVPLRIQLIPVIAVFYMKLVRSYANDWAWAKSQDRQIT